MGIRSRWRAGHMKDPVSGVFRVADWYDPHPNSSPPGTRLTGVIVADGVPPTTAETPADHQGRWVGQQELPITVDRADPTNFRVEWQQVVRNDWRSIARQRANDAAAQLAAGDPTFASAAPNGPGVSGNGMGDLSTVVEQAMRAAGLDPGLLNTAQVNVTTSFGTPTTAGFGGAQPTVESTALVTAVHDVASQVPLPDGVSQADLTLDVQRPDGSTYPVTTRIGFSTPARRAAVAVLGTRLPVLVDQHNPGRVTVDVAKLNLP